MRDIHTMSKEERQSALAAWDKGTRILKSIGYGSLVFVQEYSDARDEWEKLTGLAFIADTGRGF